MTVWSVNEVRTSMVYGLSTPSWASFLALIMLLGLKGVFKLQLR